MAKKKITDLGFTPSPYQEKIFDFVQHGVGNCVIKACAGSGKSTTIVSAMKLVPKSKKCLFIAFNKSIVEELTRRLDGYDNCVVKTIHSLGYLIARRNLGSDIEIDEYKYRTYLKKHISELTSITEGTYMTRQMVEDYIDSITMLIDYSRFNTAQSVKEIEQVAARYDIPVSFDECEVALKCLKWGEENYHTIDYTDMVWLPYELSLKPTGLQFDWIFFDEAQDASQMAIELFLRCFKRGTRFIAVGDSEQCQPTGTKITMADNTIKNIEDLSVGDELITYQLKSKCTFRGWSNFDKWGNNRHFASKITQIEHHHINSEIIRITTDKGNISEYTPEHICYAKFNPNNYKGKYILYLMRNKEGMFRIGKTKFFNDEIGGHVFGLSARMRSEKCCDGWVLDVFDDEKSARIAEIENSCMFKIPQIIFKQSRAGCYFYTDDDIVKIYKDLSREYDMEKQAKNLLNKYHRSIKYPFHIIKCGENSRHGRDYVSEYRACNLLPKVMDVIFYDINNKQTRTHGRTGRTNTVVKPTYINITNVEHIIKDTEVYSLNVENEHNYVADGIVTHNCINLFAGSSPEAFDYMCNYPNTTIFELPVTYRCAKKITEYANNLVPNMKYRDDAPDGMVIDNCHINIIKDGDMVLARSKAPLLKLYIKLLRRGINCYIKGQDIGSNLIKILENVDSDELNTDLKNDGVFVRLYDKLFTDRNKLMEKRGLDMNDATLSMNIMNMYDSINALIILAEKCQTKHDLIEHIKQIFQEDAKGVCLSTIHKAKGLEAENVYILCHSMMPSKLAHHDWEKIQEKNLQYVAYTRAKNKLGFISEKEIPPSGSMLEPTAILDELKYIENKVCKVLGKEPMQPMNNAEIAKFNLRNVTEIVNLHENDNCIDINDNTFTKMTNDYNEHEQDNTLLDQLLEFMQKGDNSAIEKVKEVMKIAEQSRG